jgi:hypothetical protein
LARTLTADASAVRADYFSGMANHQNDFDGTLIVAAFLFGFQQRLGLFFVSTIIFKVFDSIYIIPG